MRRRRVGGRHVGVDDRLAGIDDGLAGIGDGLAGIGDRHPGIGGTTVCAGRPSGELRADLTLGTGVGRRIRLVRAASERHRDSCRCTEERDGQ